MIHQPRRWMIVGANVFLVSSLALLATVAVRRFGPAELPPPMLRQIKSGPELVAVLLVASTCAASRDPKLPSLLDSIRVHLSQRAAAAGQQFVTIGVSLDNDPIAGVKFLSGLGEFDAVMAGGGWAGPGALSYLIRDLHGDLAMPQLVLLTRTVNMEQTSITSTSDQVIGRFVGASQFALLVHGVPVPPRDSTGLSQP